MKKNCSTSTNSTRVMRSTLVAVVVLLGLTLAFPAIGLSQVVPMYPSATTPPKNNFNIMMNYELGMHCTGFEFSYCCVLPPYNSILAQVVRTEAVGVKPIVLQADPRVGLDFLGRPTVVRDLALNDDGNFKKYVLRYWHDAQPRNDGRGAPQTSTLISKVEGNSLLMWNTHLDAAAPDSNNRLVYGPYDGQLNVVQGNGSLSDPEDNYANAWTNHLYFYSDLEGSNPANTSLDKNKIRLGERNLNAATRFSTVTSPSMGPAFHPMGPGAATGLNNVLTFSGDKGTVVFTQMKVLENLPVMLTSPRIWEALGLPLDPFEDTIGFFNAPGKVTEQTIRPFVQMKAQLHNFDPTKAGGIGTPVLQNGNPIIGLGTASIDIPNCERCHSLGNGASVNSPQNGRPGVAALVKLEYDFWNTYYHINVAAGDSDWYSRLKAAAISILAIHDEKHGTSFTAHYPVLGSGATQAIRLGHEAVMCQKCHADNVIAVVKSANCGAASVSCASGDLIPPMTEAIHNNHKDLTFNDAKGRTGACQGCHPAHRSDGVVDSTYPITVLGTNAFANGDNRDGVGGCYANRDVHANRNRAANLSAGKIHLNAVGQWLVTNVAKDTGIDKGIWCTNCHSQFSQEIWRRENVKDLVHSVPGQAGNVREPKANATLSDVAFAAGVSLSQAVAWLDPKNNDDTYAPWNDPDVVNYPDANVATIEILSNGQPKLTYDADSDPSVRILDFCTTSDCVAAAQTKLNAEHNGSTAVAVPFSAADDARDHWLAPGEPHCADCHAAPYTEQSGNINAFPPFNYPRKASLMRYSRGHQDITCQGCHESMHGLYPVVGNIDTTSYAQAAGMNTDGSHGPLKCGACHIVNKSGVDNAVANLTYQRTAIASNFDAAVSWMHTYTDEADPRTYICLRCHGNNSSKVSSTNGRWTAHAMKGRVSRDTMDKVEILQLGHVCGDPTKENPFNTLCKSCHGDRSSNVTCSSTKWKNHIVEGRAAGLVWEYVSNNKTRSTCGY